MSMVISTDDMYVYGYIYGQYICLWLYLQTIRMSMVIFTDNIYVYGYIYRRYVCLWLYLWTICMSMVISTDDMYVYGYIYRQYICLWLYLQTIMGHGVDCHMLGLKCVAEEEEIETPELFKDITWSLCNQFKLSTSQVIHLHELIYAGCVSGELCQIYNRSIVKGVWRIYAISHPTLAGACIV